MPSTGRFSVIVTLQYLDLLEIVSLPPAASSGPGNMICSPVMKVRHLFSLLVDAFRRLEVNEEILRVCVLCI